MYLTILSYKLCILFMSLLLFHSRKRRSNSQIKLIMDHENFLKSFQKYNIWI